MLWRYPDGQAVSVKPPYYAASCDHCAWQGSSEDCGIDTGGDDSDVYCPMCRRSGADFGRSAALAQAAPP